jgi:hypothetical protein
MELGTEIWKSTKTISYVLVSFNQLTLYAYLFIYVIPEYKSSIYIYKIVR